jgi:hypothetical protein
MTKKTILSCTLGGPTAQTGLVMENVSTGTKCIFGHHNTTINNPTSYAGKVENRVVRILLAAESGGRGSLAGQIPLKNSVSVSV